MRLAAAASAVVLLATAACDGEEEAGRGAITVLAAASLTDAFTALAHAFEATDDVTVELSFAASSSLREQILAGAPADVFASASPSAMEAVIDAGAAARSTDFAANRLQIAVPAGNPAGVTGLEDFARADLLLGLCAQSVPCGELARQALGGAGVDPSIDTDEPDVRSLLTKVAAGELDAGIVYRTDVLAGGDEVEGIDLPAAHDVVATYPIAVLSDAGEPEAADAFAAFVLSAQGQAILVEHGFELVG
jgi:molybdate transport system substrate-binding protein